MITYYLLLEMPVGTVVKDSVEGRPEADVLIAAHKSKTTSLVWYLTTVECIVLLAWACPKDACQWLCRLD